MKVGVVCREHPRHWSGGFAIAAWNTARAARLAGVDVTFITAERPDGFSGVEVVDGVRVVWLKGANHADYSSWHPAVLRDFYRIHEQEHFDIVHCHGYSGSVLAVQGVDVPIVFHDHGSKEGYAQSVLSDAVLRTHPPTTPVQVADFHDNVFFKDAMPAGESDFTHMRRYDLVLATSKVSWMDFRTRYLITHAKLFYHCIYDLPAVKYHPPGKFLRVAVFAGDLDNPWKVGVHALAKLLPMKDRIHLTMIGAGVRCKAFAKENFPNQTYFGHLPEKVAMQRLWETDVLFEPSTHHIGLNLTGISALGLGVPVLAYPTAGHYDLIGEEDEAGIVEDPVTGDVCGALDAIAERHRYHSENAWERFDSRFSPEVCARTILGYYKELKRK